jgi:SH3-like domain-containing protein
MQLVTLAFLSCVALFLGSSAIQAQSGNLQVPTHRPADTPPTSPSAAPLQPVHHDGAATHHTPVVQPHGREHAEKPATKPPAHAPAARSHETPPVPVAPPAPVPAAAAPTTKPPEAGKTDPNAPKLPRFAALRSDDVNLRSGPGTRYPIEWVYKRRDLPVEIQREFEVWRLVQDVDGIRGWVHEATLTGRRDFIVKGQDATLLGEPKEGARKVAILKVGVIGRIRSCTHGSDWCDVQAGSYRGYLRREQVWGVFPDEQIPAP